MGCCSSNRTARSTTTTTCVFAGIFGTVTGYYLNQQPGSVVTVIDSEGRGNPANGTDRWHTDGAALERPPQAASLRALVLPETGGDTVWASMYAAYDALSSHYQRLLEGLEALHTSESVYRRRPVAREALGNDQRQAVHPVVIRDPLTTRSALYVNSNWTERILGLTDRENESLLRMLFEHVNTPDFHVRFAVGHAHRGGLGGAGHAAPRDQRLRRSPHPAPSDRRGPAASGLTPLSPSTVSRCRARPGAADQDAPRWRRRGRRSRCR